MGSRFVTPEPVRLPISGGDFIDIKTRLNHGEQEDMYARMEPYVTPGAPMRLDRREVRRAKVLAYLVGWSLTDAAGKPVAVSPEAVKSLDVETFTEIYTAIETHEEVMATEREALKKTLNGPPVAASISDSPSPAVGPLPSSVN